MAILVRTCCCDRYLRRGVLLIVIFGLVGVVFPCFLVWSSQRKQPSFLALGPEVKKDGCFRRLSLKLFVLSVCLVFLANVPCAIWKTLRAANVSYVKPFTVWVNDSLRVSSVSLAHAFLLSITRKLMQNRCSVKTIATRINLNIHKMVETIKRLGISRYVTRGRWIKSEFCILN